MKLPTSIHLALCGAIVFFNHVAFAAKTSPPPPPPALDNWVTVDVAQDAINYALVTAPNGVVYAAGTLRILDEAGVLQDYQGVVRASTDGGSTWFTISTFTYPGLGTFYSAMVLDSAGNLYVSGLAQGDYITYPDDVGPAHWFVQRSGDGGATWSMVDDFVGGAWWLSESTSLAVDAAGNVFFGCPFNPQGSYNTYWTIRRGIGGANFTTVDTLSYPNNDGPQGLYSHPTAGILAVGNDRITVRNKNGTISNPRAWIVRRSLDSGNTWQTITTYQLNSSFGSSARGIGADASGNIYVVGSAIGAAVKGNYYNHWVVRKSSDGGNSWSTVDDFQLDPYNGSFARRFAAAANGTFYAAGNAYVGASDGTGNNSHWVVRKSVNGGATWTTSDDFVSSLGGTAAQSIAADNSGKVFVGGYGDAGWVVRRSP